MPRGGARGQDLEHLRIFYAPNFEKVGSILLSACACIRACVRSSVRSKKF